MTIQRGTDRANLLARQQMESATKARDKIKHGLPHLYEQKWYAWAKAYFDSRNSMNLLCAANQITKSSTQTRKWIHWATCQKIWPELWKKRPRQFWVLYPTKDVATAEWHTKLEPEFMPREEYKTHPIYGWTVEMDKKQIFAVHFNSGVTVYFKSYSQDVHSLQSGSVDAIFCDEELPEELYNELVFRLAATDGYFHMVFTATRGQLMWLKAMEGKETDELFPNAFKLQISMWDCQSYMDGTPGAYSADKIKRIIGQCKSKTEVLRRVYGKFVREDGRVCSEFDPLKNYMKPARVPAGWLIYSAIDNGGGGDSHPAAYVFFAVRPDYREGWIVFGWRGDDVVTTPGDVLEHWQTTQPTIGRPAGTVYDWAAKDLATIGERMGITLTKAEKSHDIGEHILNTLFKNNMLRVFDTPELRKLGVECLTTMKTTPKRQRKDDLLDATRYCAAQIPWDWSMIQVGDTDEQAAQKKKDKPWSPEDQAEEELRQRRGEAGRGKKSEEDANWSDYNEEIGYWNDQAGNGDG